MRLRTTNLCRPGTVLPLVAVSTIALFAVLALAIDLGIVALGRNHCQNAADVAAMTGVRVLNGLPASEPGNQGENNKDAAAAAAQAVAVTNQVIGTPIVATNVVTDVGYYSYDSTAQKFQGIFNGSKPASEAWGAVRVTVNMDQPMYFARVLGVNSMPVSAYAVAVHRPRDVAIVLDFSGSMRFSSENAYPSNGDIGGSLNPDPDYPKFGHWSGLGSVMQRTTTYVDSGGEAHAPNNLTMDTSHGPAVVRDFLYRDGNSSLQNAFHRPMATYDWTQQPDGSNFACPAPADWDVQSSNTATYGGSNSPALGGDLWPRMNKSFTTGSYAATVQQFLRNNNTTQANTHVRGTILTSDTGPGGGQFDPISHAVPLDIEGYGSTFKGYSMGPGYYGKTFYMWPPDPRYASGADPLTPDATNTAKDTSGKWMGDWRKRFFTYPSSSTPMDDNSRLWSTSTKQWQQAGSGTYNVNYTAIVKWLQTGPQTLPPNLRAGRVLYYTSIPDTIPQSGGTNDQRFWRAYIDYVIGNGSSTMQKQTGYGRQPDSDSSFQTARITANSSLKNTGNLTSPDATAPYMHYNDNPVRPRAQFWFGPLSMMMFLASNNNSSYSRNWWPGTCHEAQTWQLKAGINSALSDIEKNHPNDWVSMIYFSNIGSYVTPRVTLGKNYPSMKSALFFPFNQLANLGTDTAEVTPYNSSFSSTAAGNIPNGAGGTTPEQGFKVAYNQLSSRTGFVGRRGASKMVILETDGVPNTTCNGTFTKGSPAPYNSYYASISIGSYLGNGDATVLSNGKAAVTQICAADTASNPGYSSVRSPARVHTIAFGALFETSSTLKTQALDFLLDCQKLGNTSASSATSIESYKIITGDYATRIDNLRTAMERIMQSGVQVSLIK